MADAPAPSDLDQGIRAAKRGDRQQAAQLLKQALKQNPQNEEAWLWLARVLDDPEQKRVCLKRALQLNPNNQWAAGQLASLNAAPPAGAQPSVSPPPAQPAQADLAAPAASAAQADPAAQPLMPLQTEAPSARLKAEVLDCPKCGGQLTLRAGTDTKTVVCQYCASIIDLTPEQATIIGSVQKKLKPLAPIELGMEATFGKQRFQVIGWMRLKGSDGEEFWSWDEWLLVSEQGDYRWLSYDSEEGFTLQRKVPFQQAFDPLKDSLLPVPGGKIPIAEKATASLTALRGEFTWRATVGERFGYVEASQGDRRYTVEYGEREIELFEGKALPANRVWAAFGLKALEKAEYGLEQTRKHYRLMAIISGLFALLGLIALLSTSFGQNRIFTQQLTLSKAAPVQVVGPFEVRQPGRAYQVNLTGTGNLPVNTSFGVEVTLIDDEDREFVLYEADFWHETGVEDGESWEESQTQQPFTFRPDEAGSYTLELAVDSLSTANTLPVEVQINQGVWQGGFFVAFIIIAILLCYFFASMSAGKLLGKNAMRAIMEAGE